MRHPGGLVHALPPLPFPDTCASATHTTPGGRDLGDVVALSLMRRCVDGSVRAVRSARPSRRVRRRE